MFVFDRVLLEQVEHWQEYLALVNMILFCTGIPGYYPVSETTSSLTLTFWYTLQARCMFEIIHIFCDFQVSIWLYFFPNIAISVH